MNEDKRMTSDTDLNQDHLDLLDALEATGAILDAEGNVIACARHWDSLRETIQCSWISPKLGENFLNHLQHPITEGMEFALRLLLGLKAVLKGEKKSFSLVYPLEKDTGKTWVKTRINHFGSINGAVVIHEDISRERKAQSKLRETQQKYQYYFENSLHGILVANEEQVIIEANRKAGSILKVPVDKLVNSNITDFLKMDTDIHALQKKINNDGHYLGHHKVKTRESQSIYVELSVNLFRNEKGELVSSWSIIDVTGHFNTRKKLKRTQTFNELAVNGTNLGLWEVDLETGDSYYNEMWYNMLGYKKHEVTFHSSFFKSLVHPDDRAIPDRELHKLHQKEVEQYEVEIRMKAKDGSYRWILSLGRIVEWNSEGKPLRLAGFHLDITDRKKTEEENLRNQKLLNQLFKNSPIGIVQLDKEGNIQEANASFEEMFGYSNDDLKNKKLDKLIVPEELSNQAASLSQFSYMGDSFQTEAVRQHKSGRKIPVLIGGVPVEIDGEVISIFGIYVDITERKKLENKIIELLETEKEARHHMEDMFDEAPSAIALLEGEQHHFKFCNYNFKQLVGSKKLLGKKIEQVLPELKSQGFIQLLDLVYKSGKPIHFKEKEVYLLDQNDNPNLFYLDFIFKPLFDKENEIYGIFFEGIDVTEQVQSRKTIERSLEEKETLLSEVHHRVKNNLAIISGLLELEALNASDPKILEYLNSSQSRISTIANIHELLYKNDSLSFVPFDKYISKMLSEDVMDIDGSPQKIIGSVFELDSVNLNVNQAIPASMLINEIINDSKSIAVNFPELDYPCLILSLEEEDNTISIKMLDKSHQIFNKLYNENEGKSSLRTELIEVLLQQVYGSMTFEQENGEDILNICFERRETKGPHSALVDKIPTLSRKINPKKDR